ncbi:MAG: endonuclease III [Bacillota bacterium]|nr:endonuclease III [Bacillota bacterium]
MAIDRVQSILSILEHTYQGRHSALEYGSVFQLLVAVMLSAQTNDNQVNRVTEKLFAEYPDAAAFAQLSPEQLAPMIASLGLYQNKARNIVAASRILCEQYAGVVPADKQQLTALPGVGGKTANVVLAVGFGIPALAVDTHVYRVSRRLGLADGKTPEQVEQQLCALIPREKWAEAHHWLIWHGRRLCAARKPACAACPLAEYCPSRQI